VDVPLHVVAGEYADLMQKLGDNGTVRQAIEFFLHNAVRPALIRTVSQVVEEFIATKSAKWASEYAEARFIKVWSKVEQIDDPKLYNDVYEVFSDQKRTPRKKIRAMEFRLENFGKDRERG
jgi:hypothetical protein